MNVLWKLLVTNLVLALVLAHVPAFAQEPQCLPDLAAMDENIHSAILPFEALIEEMVTGGLLKEEDIQTGEFLTATNKLRPKSTYFVLKSPPRKNDAESGRYFIFESEPQPDQVTYVRDHLFSRKREVSTPTPNKLDAGLFFRNRPGHGYVKVIDGPFYLSDGRQFIIVKTSGEYTHPVVEEIPVQAIKNKILSSFSKIAKDVDESGND